MNKKMIGLVALVFAVVITGFSVSGTYAKYITNSEAVADSAYVAKWKVTMGETVKKDIDLFKESYLATDQESSETSIKSSDNKKIIAPGASGSYTFSVDVEAETNYTISLSDVEITDTTEKLEFQLDGTSEGSWKKASDFTTTLQNLNSGKVYAANSAASKEEHTINWRWKWVEDDETAIATTNNETARDAEYSNAAAKVTFKITVAQSQNKATN